MSAARALTAAALLLGVPARASPPTAPAVVHWGAGQGLPGPVTALRLADDGFLWVGTRRGLARFDGLHFLPEPLAERAQAPEVTALLGDPSGGQWVGTESGLWRGRDGTYERIATGELAVRSLLLASDGRLLVGTDGGLRILDGPRSLSVPGTSDKVHCLAEAGGRILAGTDGGLFELDGEHLLPLTLDVPSGRSSVRALLGDADGAAWVGTQHGLLRMAPGTRRAVAAASTGLAAASVVALVRDASGELWVGTIAGGVQRFGADRRWSPPTSSTRRAVTALVADPTGGLWAGSAAGVDFLRQSPFEIVGREKGLAGEVAWSVYADPVDEAVWVGLDGHGLDRVAHGLVTPSPRRWGLAAESIVAILRTSDGSLWVAATRRGLQRTFGDAALPVLGPEGERVERTSGLIQARDGTVWIGTNGRVLRWRSGPRAELVASPGDTIWAFAEGPAGEVWVGGARLQLLVGGVERTPAPLREVRDVVAMRPDADGVWIVGYFSGLQLWSGGRLHRLGELDRRFAGRGIGLVDDRQGRSWYVAEDRLVAAPTEALRALAEGRVERISAVELGERDGLPCGELNSGGQSSVARAADGRLWFACVGGALVVDPGMVAEPDPARPPTMVTTLVDGERGRPSPSSTLDVDHLGAALELRYTSPTARAHRLEYRHRLEGHDRDWVPGGPEGLARYSMLGEGSYAFRFEASLDGGPWVPAAPVRIVVRPRLWERKGPRVLLGAAAAAALAVAGLAAVRIRERRLRARAETLRRLVEERTRDLAEARDQLETRVRERTARLQEELSHRDRLERQLLDVQKLDSIGRLAGGVAHDLNNLLTVVLGFASAARLAEGVPAHAIADLDEVERAGRRAAALTRQLLAFARRQHLEVRRLDLREVVVEASRLLRRLVGEQIPLATDLPPDPCPVLADAAQLEQVLVNLAANARDAMPHGGKLHLLLDTVRLGPEHVADRPGVTDGEYVRLKVSDTGVGMTAEVMSHLFEPFFTTKEKGRGTGLGLATCYGILRQLGGHIWAESAPGAGTTVTILLPRSEGPLHGEPKGSLAHRGDERLLLVEDEPQVLALGARALRDRGYRVLIAGDGQEALDLLAGTGEQIDLLVTDVTMPRVGGIELAARLRERWPDLPVLFVTGYADETVPEARETNRMALVLKPFTSEELAARVRQVLGPPKG